ncbi:MAG TPA: LytTR family DNA-binding domain-containing protein [Flavitalea sp.]|nr:LytTR family DNA-binding domain-containing protein [Flavitalea sp.]
MEKFNCIIVEDEPLAAEILEDYVKQVPFLSLKAVCSDAIYAMEILKKETIQVVFLDIHLPKLKGIDFIKTLKNAPQIIITTAYRDYAIEGYELSVLDYLVKPIDFNRFLMAVNKVKQQQIAEGGSGVIAPASEKPHLFFNVNKKMIKIYVEEILYIESLKEYIRIVAKGKSILTKMQLSQIEDQLAKSNFIRIHRSFLVAKEKIEAFTAIEVDVGGKQLPIGRSYKELVLSVLGGGV